jgi:hypothetical protein
MRSLSRRTARTARIKFGGVGAAADNFIKGLLGAGVPVPRINDRLNLRL